MMLCAESTRRVVWGGGVVRRREVHPILILKPHIFTDLVSGSHNKRVKHHREVIKHSRLVCFTNFGIVYKTTSERNKTFHCRHKPAVGYNNETLIYFRILQYDSCRTSNLIIIVAQFSIFNKIIIVDFVFSLMIYLLKY